MSASITPNDASPSTIQPLHNPSQAAQVVIPQAPLGNVVNQAPGMGAKALFAKKFTKAQCAYLQPNQRMSTWSFYSNPNFISPTDNLMTPVTQKLNEAKKKQFTKYASLLLIP